MSRKIKALCNVYSSKEEILKEWMGNLEEGKLAVGKDYTEQKNISEYYGFAMLKNGKYKINRIEAEIIEDIFKMKMFGISSSKICKKLINYKNPPPRGLSQWNIGVVEEILKDEYFAGYKFIFQEEKVLVMQVGVSIIPKRIFALIQELNLKEEQLSQQERLKRLGNMLFINMGS